MASFKKRPNGSYQATIYVGRDANGKQLFEYVTRQTLKECKAAAREIEQDLEDRKYINVGKTKVVAWIEKWLELNKSRLSPSTYVTYKLYLNVHYAPYFKNMRLDKLIDIHIKEFMAYQLEKGLSPTTVRKHVSVLNKMLQEILKHKNPAKDVPLPTKEKYVPHVPNEAELDKILEVVKKKPKTKIKSVRDEILVLLAAWCGMRRGEIFALKPNDIDWEQGIITVDEARTINDDNEYEDKAPKSDNGFRKVVVPDYLMQLLETLRKSWRKIPEYIFPLRPDTFSSYFAELIRENGLPHVRFHDLRHYHATWLYKNNIPDKYAAERLGHDIQTLKTIYQHIGADHRKDIDDNIRNLYDKKDKKDEKATNDS